MKCSRLIENYDRLHPFRRAQILNIPINVIIFVWIALFCSAISWILRGYVDSGSFKCNECYLWPMVIVMNQQTEKAIIIPYQNGWKEITPVYHDRTMQMQPKKFEWCKNRLSQSFHKIKLVICILKCQNEFVAE